ncbi:hypothetical protein [Parafrankia elaeagni]|uniref:hypothetical protein n=1 Tax=Parafrankia elaeagni TaxID=222534 RepID=UPI000380E7F6|nr:hypothetical protein [Parafrankia elaeagni]
MTPRERAVFIAAYTNLVVDVWSNPHSERQLADDPRALLARHGVPVPDGTRVVAVRDVVGSEPDLDVQVRYWQEAPATGEMRLVVPTLTELATAELDEAELDGVVAGVQSTCACCCPCCCS